LIDPFHRRRDRQTKVLPHVAGAFREDRVRILHVAERYSHQNGSHIQSAMDKLSERNKRKTV